MALRTGVRLVYSQPRAPCCPTASCPEFELGAPNDEHLYDLGYVDGCGTCEVRGAHAERAYCGGAIAGMGACAGSGGMPPCVWFRLTDWPDVFGAGSIVDAEGREFFMQDAAVEIERWDPQPGSVLHGTFQFSLPDGRSASGELSLATVEEDGCLL